MRLVTALQTLVVVSVHVPRPTVRPPWLAGCGLLHVSSCFAVLEIGDTIVTHQQKLRTNTDPFDLSSSGDDGRRGKRGVLPTVLT